MRFEYTLLLMLSIFPLIYKLGYWQSIFKEQGSDIKNFGIYLLSKQGRESLIHFWSFLEIPMLFLSIIPLFDSAFEYLFYPMFFYFLVFYNIFVLGKIFRKKIHLPVKNAFLCLVLSFIWILFIIPFIYPLSIYVSIASILLFIPIFLIVSQILLNIVANKKA